MALSKEVSVEALPGEDKVTLWMHTMAAAEGNLKGAVLRVGAPFQELWEDASEALVDSALHCYRVLSKAALFDVKLFLASGRFRSVKGREASSSSDDPDAARRDLLCEVSQSPYLFPCGLMSLLAAFDPTGVAGVTLCGLSMKAKWMHMFVGAFSTYGAWQMLYRFDEDEIIDKSIQLRSSTVLALSAGVHFFLSFYGAPTFFVEHFVHPEIAFQLSFDMIANPLMLANLGFVSGLKPVDIMTPLVASSMGAGALLATTMPLQPNQIFICLGSSATVLMLLAQNFTSMERAAREVNSLNASRSKLSGDMMLFAWSLMPCIQALSIAGPIPAHFQIYLVAVAGGVTKVGIAHILAKSRYALEAASLHLQARAMQAIMGAYEPQIEPPPENQIEA